jgi:hypothetical protein
LTCSRLSVIGSGSGGIRFPAASRQVWLSGTSPSRMHLRAMHSPSRRSTCSRSRGSTLSSGARGLARRVVRFSPPWPDRSGVLRRSGVRFIRG